MATNLYACSRFFLNALLVFVLLSALACQNAPKTEQTTVTPPDPAATANATDGQVQIIKGDSLVQIAAASSAKVNELVVYIDNLSKAIFEEAGGPLKDDPARPVLYQDTTISTKFLIGQRKGYELMQKIQTTRQELLELVGSPEELTATLPLQTNPQSNKGDWVKDHFENVPVALIFPQLKKIKSEARQADQMIREQLQ